MAAVPSHDDRTRHLQSRADHLHRGSMQLLRYSHRLRTESNRLLVLSEAICQRALAATRRR